MEIPSISNNQLRNRQNNLSIDQQPFQPYSKTIYCGYANKNSIYGNNKVTTTRYNPYNIIPLYLWDVFNPKHKLANIFFLIVSILQCIPSISLTNGLPSSLPSLLTIIGAEAVHMGILEYKRKKSDKEMNNHKVLVWNEEIQTWETKQWKDIFAGDIIKVYKNEDIPCDMVLLSTSEGIQNSHCYITTMNIDGETDIKTKSALHTSSSISITSFLLQQPILYCEAENPNTSSFDGVMKYDSQVERISINSVLLRGCRLVFTGFFLLFTSQIDWIIGCAVSVGSHTKIEYSTKSRPRKKESETLLLLNHCIIYLLLLLFIICMISALLSVLWDSKPHANINIHFSSYAIHFIQSFLVYFQLCYQIVPASLYVCVEIALILQTFFMEMDLDCYELDTEHIRVRNVGILDELGHVTHILSDKTGTITENNLQVISIQSITATIPIHNIYYSQNQYRIDSTFHLLLLNMTINHSALSIQDSSLSSTFSKSLSSSSYQSFSEIRVASQNELSFLSQQSNNHNDEQQIFCSSQDERAILDAVGDFDYRFVNRSLQQSTITIEYHGIQQTLKILHFFPFSPQSKRTSIICILDMEYWLFCKGADSTIYPLLQRNDPNTEQINQYVDNCSRKALRTLVFAYKKLSKEEYSQWLEVVESSGYSSNTLPLSLQERIEKDMNLQGAVAIQDDLAHDVYYSIKRLQAAGIRFWILTGDKADTAEAIAKAAGVVHQDHPILYLTSSRLFTSNHQQQEEEEILEDILNEYKTTGSKQAILVDEGIIDRVLTEPSIDSIEPSIEHLQTLFFDCLCNAEAVIISRMRKDQKQQITFKLKEYSKCTKQTIHILCIGDGANDMGMLRESDIGIGIKGKEGLQAFNNCDIGIPSFSCLTKLLLVHGKNNEMRLQNLILYFLYKNTLLSLVILLLSYLTVFSGLKVLPSWGIDFYNTYFTSVPILTLAAIDFVASKELLIRTPQLYSTNWYKPRLTKKRFILNMLTTILESFLLLGCCFLFFPSWITVDAGMNMTISISYLGAIIFTIMVITANLRILFIATCHYYLLILFVLFSILLWFGTFAVISGFIQFPAESWDLYGTFVAIFHNPQTILVILFCVVLFILRSFSWLAFRRMINPSPTQIVNEMNDNEYSKVKTNESHFYSGKSNCLAAKKVNLTIQSFLKQEDLLLRQMQSVEQDEPVVIPLSSDSY